MLHIPWGWRESYRLWHLFSSSLLCTRHYCCGYHGEQERNHPSSCRICSLIGNLNKKPQSTVTHAVVEKDKGFFPERLMQNFATLAVHSNQLGAVKNCHGWDLQDGGGVRCGDHHPPHKYIRNASTWGSTPTEHRLNTGRTPQTSQKARNSPRTWVGQKKNTETKE